MSEVVVLTRNFTYWGERSLHDALKLYARGKIEIVKADESHVIRAGVSRDGVIFKMPAPLVVRLLDFVGWKIKHELVRYSPEAVYERDDNFCQYWHHNEMGKRFMYKCTVEDRSIDHIMPDSRGGRTDFSNCVCACHVCNIEIKKNRTPREVGLELIRQPTVPKLNKGDMAIISFSFNPHSRAHQAMVDLPETKWIVDRNARRV